MLFSARRNELKTRTAKLDLAQPLLCYISMQTWTGTFDCGRVTRENLCVTRFHKRIDFASPFHLHDIRELSDRDVDKIAKVDMYQIAVCAHAHAKCLMRNTSQVFAQLFANVVGRYPSKSKNTVVEQYVVFQLRLGIQG